jgi:hypothetical protein
MAKMGRPKKAVIKDKSVTVRLSPETYQKYDCHIAVVCHPRKAEGFLRLDDVSGSGNLTNAADACFIMHRVNEDF